MKTSAKNSGEASSTANVDTMIVTMNHVTAHSSIADGRGYLYKNYFDFSEVSMRELLLLAAETILIRARTKFNFRNHENPSSLDGLTFDVAEMLKNAKTRKGPTIKVNAKTATQMSSEQLEAAMAILKSAQEAKRTEAKNTTEVDDTNTES